MTAEAGWWTHWLESSLFCCCSSPCKTSVQSHNTTQYTHTCNQKHTDTDTRTRTHINTHSHPYMQHKQSLQLRQVREGVGCNHRDGVVEQVPARHQSNLTKPHNTLTHARSKTQLLSQTGQTVSAAAAGWWTHWLKSSWWRWRSSPFKTWFISHNAT